MTLTLLPGTMAECQTLSVNTNGPQMSLTLETLQRQWQTLRLIPRYPRKISGRELTERLSSAGFTVTKRTVERDLQSMSAVFPLVADIRNKPYGWSWAKGAVALDLPALSPSEATSFLMLRQFLEPLMPASTLDQLAPYFGMAEQCLAVQGTGSLARQWLKKVAIVPTSQPLLPPVIREEVQNTVQEALLRNRQLRLRYQKRGERSETEYIAHPLGLVQRGGVFYLVVTLFDYADVKLLVMHRLRRAEMLDEACRRPKGFDLAAYIAAGNLGFGKDTQIDLVLRFTREAGEHLWETPLCPDQQITELADGRLEVRATVTDSLQIRWWLLGFADGVEVMAPRALRKELAERLRLAARRYGD